MQLSLCHREIACAQPNRFPWLGVYVAVDSDGPTLDDVFRASYAPLVRALTVAYGPEAADAVQEAYAQAHVRWRKIRSYDDPVAWIRRVSVNRLLNESRNRKRRRSHHLSAAADLDGPTSDRVAMAAALGALPLQQRVAVTLHYIADLSVAEVAEVMSLSPGTVKSHLHHARAALRTMLEAVDD